MNWLDQLHYELEATDIAQKVEDTFGPNLCTGLKLHNETSGEILALICDQKRCVHCSPRKQMTIQLQMQALGEYVFVARLTDLTDLNRSLERIKKQSQRGGIDYKYQIVGDERLGWIVISTVELLTEQRYMKLSDWTKRILDLYRYARGRIRRSYALGRVSLVPYRRRRNSGQGSSWYRRTADTEAVRAVEDLEWNDLRDEIDYEHGNLYDYDPTGGEAWVSPM